MKKIIITIKTVIALLISANTASAQGTMSKNDNSGIEKEVVLTTSATNPTMLNTKVLKSFEKNFSNATPTWSAYQGKFVARFYEDGNKVQALFNKNGKMLYSVTHGNESLLPKQLISVISANYPCYKIGTVSKANSLGKTAWTADITKDNKLVIIKIIDGEIAEATEFKTGI